MNIATLMYFGPLTILVLLVGVAILYFTRNRWRSRDPNRYELQHFRAIDVTDSWNGQSECEIGSNCQYILYGEQVVHFRESFRYESGESKLFSSPKDKFFPTMLRIGGAYRHIYQYLRHKVELQHQGFLSAKHAEVTLVQQDQSVLESHRQYAEVTMRFAKEFDVLFNLKRINENTVRIVLDKI